MDIIFQSSALGAEQRGVSEKLEDLISVRDFGAVSDGVADDTAAVQAAIDYCLSLPRAGVLLVPGTCRIGHSLIVDRPVDTTSDLFIIRGEGKGAGFLLDDGVVLFDSSLVFSTVPVSERVTLRDLRIGLATGATDGIIFSQKFLRVQLFNVFGRGVRLMEASGTYAQDWHIGDGCNFAAWTGVFFSARGAFEVVSIRTAQYRVGNGDVFNLYDPGGVNGVSGCSIYGSFESNTGSPLRAGGVGGLRLGGYFEANGDVTADFTLGPNASITLDMDLVTPAAPHLADPDFFEILWGQTAHGVSIGCRSQGRLHDDTLMTGPLISVGESALVLNKSGRHVEALPAGMQTMTNGIVAHAGGGQTDAVPLTATTNRIIASSATGDSVKLPPTFDLGVAQSVTIINDSPYAIQVYGTGSDSVNFQPAASGWPQASGVTVTYYSVMTGRWSG